MLAIRMFSVYLPAKDGRNGIARFIPQDQPIPKGWETLDGSMVNVGAVPKEQIVRDMEKILNRLPIIGIEQQKEAPKQDNTKSTEQANKLRKTAEKIESAAREKLNQDRLTNTPKRAREAGYLSDRLNKEIQLAKTMMNIADAIESGDAKMLSGITARTQVGLLDSLLNQAKYQADRKNKEGSVDRHRPAAETDIPFAQFPKPYQDKGMLYSLAEKLGKVKGGKALAKTIESKARVTNDRDGYKFHGEEDFALMNEISKKLGKDTPWQIADGIKSVNQLRRIGVNNDSELHKTLKEYLQYRGGAPKVDKIKQMEMALVGQKTGVDFFPTPKARVKEIVDRAGIEKGMKVLEPGAGTGNLAEEMRNQGADVDVAEISSAHREILEAKGFNVVEHDFMDLKEGSYDRIVMNPPFSKNMDIEHVRHAYDLLKPGGKLVSIMGEGAFFRSGKTETAFREWLDEVGFSEKLPEKFFMDKKELRTTGVNARVVEIDKPQEQTSEVKPESIKYEPSNYENLKPWEMSKKQFFSWFTEGSLPPRRPTDKGWLIKSHVARGSNLNWWDTNKNLPVGAKGSTYGEYSELKRKEVLSQAITEGKTIHKDALSDFPDLSEIKPKDKTPSGPVKWVKPNREELTLEWDTENMDGMWFPGYPTKLEKTTV